jgi:hypothetical protein
MGYLPRRSDVFGVDAYVGETFRSGVKQMVKTLSAGSTAASP